MDKKLKPQHIKVSRSFSRRRLNLGFTYKINKKLSRATGLLAKIRYYTSIELRRTIYYALFDSHIRYACPIRAQSNNGNIQELLELQYKAVRIISFKNKYTPINPLLKEQKILTLKHIVLLENCNLVLQYINNNLP